MTATIVNGNDGAHLALTSRSTGKSGGFSVNAIGGDGGLARLAFDPAVDAAVIGAQDAEFSVNGVATTSPSNTVTSVIDGLTLSLQKAGDSSVVVQADTSEVAIGLTSLVAAYNQFVSQYRTVTGYDAAKAEAGAMIGDATVTAIKTQVSALLGARVSSGHVRPNSLSDLGVAFQVGGTLSFNTARLANALAISSGDVQDLLSGPRGIAVTLARLIAGWTSKNGILSRRAANLQVQAKAVERKAASFETSMEAYSNRIARQYTSLDTLMSKLDSTSAYLQRQFDALSSGK